MQINAPMKADSTNRGCFEEHLNHLAAYAIYFVEFLGTFFLVFTVGCTNVEKTHAGPFAAIAIGSVLMACVFMGGHISGAHYNPAVTFGVWMSGRGKISGVQSIGYVIAQLTGSLIAGIAYWTITDETFQIQPGPGTTKGHALSGEVLFTFLLVSVVLNTATTKSNSDNSFYGLAIGFTVLSGAIAVGPLSGGAFNPAVGFGTTAVEALNNGAGKFHYLWIYILGPCIGSVLASLAFRITTHHSEYRADIGAVVNRDRRTAIDPPSHSSQPLLAPGTSSS